MSVIHPQTHTPDVFVTPTGTHQIPRVPDGFMQDHVQMYICKEHGEVAEVGHFQFRGERRGPFCLRCMSAYIRLLPTVPERVVTPEEIEARNEEDRRRLEAQEHERQRQGIWDHPTRSNWVLTTDDKTSVNTTVAFPTKSFSSSPKGLFTSK